MNLLSHDALFLLLVAAFVATVWTYIIRAILIEEYYYKKYGKKIKLPAGFLMLCKNFRYCPKREALVGSIPQMNTIGKIEEIECEIFLCAAPGSKYVLCIRGMVFRLKNQKAIVNFIDQKWTHCLSQPQQ